MEESPGKAPDSTVPTPKFNVRDSKRTDTIITIIAGVFCASAVVVLLYFSKSPDTHPQRVNFCCPDEVQRLASTVNRSIKPCADFYGHICSTYESLILAPFLRTGDQLLHEIRRGERVGSSQAKYHLLQYDQACMKTLRPFATFAGHLTSGIIEEFGIGTRMTRQQVAVFLLETNLVYRLESVFVIRATFPRIGVRKYFPNKTFCESCATEAIDTFNSHFKTNVTVKDLTKLSNSIQDDGYVRRAVNISVVRDLFSDVSDESWNEIQDKAFVPLDAEKAISVPNKTNLKDALDNLARPRNQPTSVALMILSAVLSAILRFKPQNQEMEDPSLQEDLQGTCFQQLKSLRHFSENMLATEFTNRAKDDHIMKIHAAVMKFVAPLRPSGRIFSKEDEPQVALVLQSVRIVLPSDYAMTDIRLPNMTNEFGRNYIRCLTYEAQSRQAMIRQQLPRDMPEDSDIVVVDNVLYVSPRYYAALNFESPNKMVLNMAVLGIRMAESLWNYLMTSRNWSSETSSKVQQLYRCFKDRPVEGMRVAQTALAIRTVLYALERSNWKDRRTWKGWKLSLGELFYMWYANSMCRPWYTHGEHENVNAPLRQVDDFAETFQCSSLSPMANKTVC